MKRCGRCLELKTFDAFHRRGRGYQTWCKGCRRPYDSAYHHRTKARRLKQKKARHVEMAGWYRALKTNRPCADCGGHFHPAAMTWDHLPGAAKVAEVSSLLSRHSKQAILDEISKCELVCANCHAVRTFTRNRDVAQPG